MATRNIVPRVDGEGSLGKATKRWGALHVVSIAFDTLGTLVTRWNGTTGRRTFPLIDLTEIAPGTLVERKAASALSDANATLTASQLISNGILVMTPTSARDLTLPTATEITTLAAGYVAGSCYEFHIINLGHSDITLIAGTGITLVGDVVIWGSQYPGDFPAGFKLVINSSSTVTIYRVS